MSTRSSRSPEPPAPLRAGFAQTDITPPVGTLKIGWIKDVVSDHVLDGLFARAAVLESGAGRIAIVALDTLSVPASLVGRMREGISRRWGFPGENVMVCATHNHAGPAVANVGLVRRDDAYVADLVAKVVSVFGAALEGLVPAEIGFGRGVRFGIAHNRRLVMRDGTVRTHANFSNPDALYVEGPIDPEVAVVAVRRGQGGGKSPPRGGGLMGVVVNFACHPTHHGPDGALSAGYPGALAAAMKSRGCPVTLFLQGAAGNVHFADPAAPGPERPMEEIGERLADDASAALEKMEFTAAARIACRRRTIEVPLRDPTDEQVRGTCRGAQRFVDAAAYDRLIPELVERIRRRPTEPAEVQVLRVNDVAIVGIPGELFVEHGLAIKERAYPARALVVECANGQLGYIPTKQAFERGGYETTFAPWSRVAPEAGDLLVRVAGKLIRQRT